MKTFFIGLGLFVLGTITGWSGKVISQKNNVSVDKAALYGCEQTIGSVLQESRRTATANVQIQDALDWCKEELDRCGQSRQGEPE